MGNFKEKAQVDLGTFEKLDLSQLVKCAHLIKSVPLS